MPCRTRNTFYVSRGAPAPTAHTHTNMHKNVVLITIASLATLLQWSHSAFGVCVCVCVFARDIGAQMKTKRTQLICVCYGRECMSGRTLPTTGMLHTKVGWHTTGGKRGLHAGTSHTPIEYLFTLCKCAACSSVAT